MKFQILKDYIFETKSRVKNKDIPIFSVTNTNGLVPSSETFNKIVHSKNVANYKEVKPNFFAYNPSRINVGSIALNINKSSCAVSPMYTVFECNTKHLLPKYLLYFLKSKQGLNDIKNRTTGTVRFQLKFNQLSNLSIFLPSLSEQQSLVSALEEVDELIKKQKQALELTRQMIPSLFDEMFGNININNKKFTLKKISEVINLNPKDKLTLKDDSKITFIPMSAINSEKGIIAYPEIKLFKETRKKGFSSFKNGDILFAKITPCMQNKKSAIVEKLINEIGFGSTEFHVLRPSECIIGEYLLQILRSSEIIEHAKNNFTGTSGHKRVPKSFIANLTIPLPPITLQKKFKQKIDEIKSLQLKQEKSLKNLELLFESLLHKFFSQE